MRVSTSQLHAAAINSITDQQLSLSKTQLQISAGRRILTPADDPAGAARALNLSEAVSITEQFDKNADLARGRLGLEETTLESVENILQRVRELALQGNNDSQNADTRSFIAAEIRQRFDELLSLANTRDPNGEYIFSGFQSLTQAFSRNPDGSIAYNGDEGQRFTQIGSSRQIAVRDPGTAIFEQVKNGNGEFLTRNNPANTGTGIIDPGTITDPGAYVPDNYSLVFGEQTTVTGGAIGITDTGIDDVLQYELRVNGTLVYTANEGDSRTLAELETDINAQSGITNVTAYVDGGQLYLANTTPTATPITITESLTGATENTDTVTGYFGSVLTGIGTPSIDIVLDTDASDYVVVDGAGVPVTSGSYLDGADIEFNGIRTNVSGTPANGDQFDIDPSNNQSLFTTLQNLAGTLESRPQTDAEIAAFHNEMNRVLTDLDQGVTSILNTRILIGARLNSIEDQTNLNSSTLLQIRTTLAEIQDLDYAEAISRLEQQRINLEASQASFVRIQGLSLFNYL